MLKVELPSQIVIHFFLLNNERVLVLKLQNNSNNLYVFVPRNIDLVYSKAYTYSLKMHILTNKHLFDSFYIFFLDCLRRIQKPLIRKLIIKGLGLKAKAFRKLRILEFKLGFSYPIIISIPKEIFLFLVIKNTIFIKGFDSAKLGNFLYRIKLLKFPNIYKGKGFWYKNEKIEFKPIKK